MMPVHPLDTACELGTHQLRMTMGSARGSKVSVPTQQRTARSFHPHCIRLPVPINPHRGTILISITIKELAGTVTHRPVRSGCSNKRWECTEATTAVRRCPPGINIRRRISIIIRILTTDTTSSTT